MYLWENPQWPKFTYQEAAIERALKAYSFQKAKTLAAIKLLDPNAIKILNADAFFSDAVSSSAIEGVNVSYDSVYFFLAKALNLDFKSVVYKVYKNSESLASLVLDAFTQTTL
jgi:Fic family protein